MTTLFTYQKQEENFKHILSEHIKNKSGLLSITGNGNTFGAYLISQLHSLSKKIIVVVTNTQKNAKRYVDELKFFTGNNYLRQIIHLPTYDVSVSPLKQEYNKNEILSKRIASLHDLLQKSSNLTIVTDLSGIKQKIISVETLMKYFDLIKLEKKINPEIFIRKLIYGGYKKTFIVEERGTFSIRRKKKIIDIFPPIYTNPVRIELSSNVIKFIRFFSSINQRTIKNIDEFILLPMCETVLESDRVDSTINDIRIFGIKHNLPCNYIEKVINDIKNQHKLPITDGNTVPLMYNYMDSLFDYIPESSLIVTVNQSKWLANDSFIENYANTIFHKAIKHKKLCIRPKNIFLKYSLIEQKILSRNSIDYKISVTSGNNESGVKNQSNLNYTKNRDINVMVQNYKNYEKSSSSLIRILLENQTNGYSTIIVCSAEDQVGKIAYLLSSENIKFIIRERFSYNNVKLNTSVCICIGKVNSGFIFPRDNLSIIVYEEIFLIKKSPNKKIQNSTNNSNFIDISNLRNGEYVVHPEHGIGQYKGLIKLNISGAVGDFLLIIYRDNDKLYLPVDRMELIHKYMSHEEGYIPCVDKIGEKSWERLKNKVSSSAEKITGTLLKIYAKRKVQEGYGFRYKDKTLMKFVSLFKHKETPDQSKAINDVLGDMQKNTPMDRLVCGDVGYGKTEIALRASFVAIEDKKQVAILVPTTILAEQHFITFTNRFKKYPIKIACLSRFRSKKDQEDIIKNTKNGLINIVIGTHRLLQNDVSFMNIGLLILDEEQRFGVEHKEKIKQIKTSVDVLTLTATPIPRTLYLSLVGIRDISVIATPPSHRQPIITQILEFDYELIAMAIRKELDRKGQVFFIHNNIKTIQLVARQIQICVPEVKLRVAHGQMDEGSLESTMVDFIKGEIDMIVCTTIIESGIDIAKANTIMINRADKLGLAQIYQIRGRVGRSNKQAYAYLFVPSKDAISNRAQRRLKVIMEHNKLGSGFEVAMNDMKIRGGGTILGASQAGHISAVGYDMFLKLMEESVDKIKGKIKQELFNTEVNIPIPAFIPEDYVSDIDHRFTIYQKIARIKQLKDLFNLKEELIDRFGEMPEETKNLFLKIVLKILGIHAGIKKINVSGNNLTLFFNKKNKANLLSTIAMMANNKDYCYKLEVNYILTVQLNCKNEVKCLAQTRKILVEIKDYINS